MPEDKKTTSVDEAVETVIHVNKKQSPSTSSSANFRTVKEEPWGRRIESYLLDVMKACEEKSSQHDEAGYFFKSKKVKWGLPMVIVPAICSPLSLMLAAIRGGECGEFTVSDYLNSLGFMVTALFTAVYGFFDYGMKYQQHFNHSYIFGRINSKVKAEMVKHRKFRRQADVFMVEVNMELDNAIRNEPILPKSILRAAETDKKNGISRRMSQLMPPLEMD